MADVVTNHPDIKSSRAFRASTGAIIKAMIAAGIEAGVYPPGFRHNATGELIDF
jgi:hypothetical protein